MDNTKSKAVFLDRDGTLNTEVNYLSRFEDFIVIPKAIAGLQALQQLGYRLFVITNQSGVARKYFTYQAVIDLNAQIQDYFKHQNVFIEEFAFCPHHPYGIDPEYTKECDCRKPMPGMIFRLQRKYNLDLSQSYMVGDKLVDAEAGFNAGTKSALVKTGHPYKLDKGSNIKEFNTLLDFAKSLSV